MPTIHRFEDLEVWKQSRSLAKEIYEHLKQGVFAKDFGLRDQMSRSSGSIMDNIAEGFERDGRKEFIQFLAYAKGSAGELRSQLYRALDRKYITDDDFAFLSELAFAVSKSLSGFISYLKKSEYGGTKYKVSEPTDDILSDTETNSKSKI